MNLNILPSPERCLQKAGGVNSVVADHALGFLASGCEISNNGNIHIIHALEQSDQIDVFHCHGLYPIGNGYFDRHYSKANDIVLSNALKARVTICISEFSANILRHKLHIDPVVTRNGIWTSEYKRGGMQSGAVLFPKVALDANAIPDDVIWLKRNSDLPLLSIANISGIRSTGRLSRPEFIETLQSCSIYLGTTKENNSMATMEAMVIGLPVVGYDIGFNSEWLINGDGCELVPYGDQIALLDALHKVKSNWKKYSDKARDYAQLFDWQPVIDELLGIYRNLENLEANKSVSIVIPSHNYGEFVGQAIESALAQTVPCEVIVIDDKSSDNSPEIIRGYPVKFIRNEVNLGVAESRNKAIAQSTGKFVVCLDADDVMLPNFVEKHLQAFRTNEDAITYSHIQLVDRNGDTMRKFLFNADARPELQFEGRNQIPSCCMFRKSFWERAGGYDKRFSPAEDAHLWLKIFQLGGKARKASVKHLMDYRIHGSNVSNQGFPNWWNEAQNFIQPIRDRDAVLTIIIDEQNEGIKDTLWSLENQTVQNWECQLKSPNNLRRTFPWLNRISKLQPKSILHLKSGVVLSPRYLEEYMMQIPEWL